RAPGRSTRATSSPRAASSTRMASSTRSADITLQVSQKANGNYRPGTTLEVSNSLSVQGQANSAQDPANLLSLLWRPNLPKGWTITAVSGEGSPSLSPDGREILFTAGRLPVPLRFSYRIAVPADANGKHQLSTQIEYIQAGMSNPAQLTDTVTISE
ncbi:hypothetical protein U5801_25625, partial [Lamprobacter modestohalophilus]|uniref:hypothetical protein n=1 Tax=Lamprobacter modestohalophilus TaxID=1064514 RepID=UPI002ADED5BE